MNSNDKKSEVFSYFENVKGECLARSNIISLKKGLFKQIFAFVLMKMCSCLKEHISEVIDCVFCALCMACSGSAVSWNRQDPNPTGKACNECKTLDQLGLVCV